MRHLLTLAITLVSLVMPGLRAQAQPLRVDPEVRRQGRTIARALSDTSPLQGLPGVQCSVVTYDGRVFMWHISLEPPFGVSELAEQVGIPPVDPLSVFNAWVKKVNTDIVSATARAVRDAGTDPSFNAETDVSLSISFRTSPRRSFAKRPATKEEMESLRPDYSASFTGTRRNEQSTPSRGELFRDADGPPRGGSLEYTIVPDRATWSHRETIRGTVTVRNTGETRVHVPADFQRTVAITSSDGERPRSGNAVLFTHPAPDTAPYRFLSPGEIVAARFELRADPLDNGLILPEGEWDLRIKSLVSNVACNEPIVRIAVVQEPGQWHGPRILQVVDAGSSIVLVREGFIAETLRANDLSSLGSATVESEVPIYVLPRLDITASDSGRLIAFQEQRSKVVRVESTFGERPAVDRISLPLGMPESSNGHASLTPSRFSPDEQSLHCAAPHASIKVDLSDGNETVSRTECMWGSISPDGSVIVDAPRPIVPARFREDGESFVTTMTAAIDGQILRQVEIVDAGDAADTRMGASGAYLCSDRMPVVVYLPYEAGPQRRFVTEAPATFIGESADGLLAAFEWPRRDPHHARATTAIGIYRVSTGERIATIRLWGDRPSVMLDDPARIMSFERVAVASDNESAWYLAEHAVVHDAVSGFPLQTIHLTPR